MRIAAMIAAAAMVGMAANEELSDPKVTAAILRAWEQTRNGLSRNEAGFRLDARRAGYEIVEGATAKRFPPQMSPFSRGGGFPFFPGPPPQSRSRSIREGQDDRRPV